MCSAAHTWNKPQSAPSTHWASNTEMPLPLRPDAYYKRQIRNTWDYNQDNLYCKSWKLNEKIDWCWASSLTRICVTRPRTPLACRMQRQLDDKGQIAPDASRVGFLPEETYFFRDTRKKVEETYFFQFCPDKTGRNWTKVEKTVKDVRNAGKK